MAYTRSVPRLHIALLDANTKAGEDQLFYLMSRGIPEDEATAMVLNGFVEPVTKEIPLQYAVELNRFMDLHMEGSIE